MAMEAASRNDWATIPNAITLLRFFLVIPICIFLISDTRPTLTAALLLAFGLSDWVDGFIARKFSQVSRLGILLDPVADRLGIVAIAVALVAGGFIPVWIGVVIFFTDLVLLCAYFFLRLSEPPSSTLLGKFRTALIMLGLAFVAAGRIDQLSIFYVPGIYILYAGALLHIVVGFGYLRYMRSEARTANRPGEETKP